MKHINNFLIPFLFVFSSINALSWYKSIVQELYPINCRFIDLAHYIHKTSQLACHSLYNQEKITQQLKTIELQLKNYENAIFAQEKKALHYIKHTFNIPDKQWDVCLKEIKQIKEINKQEMKKTDKNVVHDAILPENVQLILTSLLQQNDINPANITIKKSSKKNSHYAHVTWHFKKNDLTHYIPPKIVVFPQTFTLSSEEVTAICAHEVEHLVQQHAVTKESIITCIQQHNSLTRQEIINHEAFQKLIQVHEAQAEILPALRNSKIAFCMKKLRENKFYIHGNLHEFHYYQLSSINKLWTLHQSLTMLCIKNQSK